MALEPRTPSWDGRVTDHHLETRPACVTRAEFGRSTSNRIGVSRFSGKIHNALLCDP